MALLASRDFFLLFSSLLVAQNGSSHGMRNEIEASEQKDDFLKEKEQSQNWQILIKDARSGEAYR